MKKYPSPRLDKVKNTVELPKKFNNSLEWYVIGTDGEKSYLTTITTPYRYIAEEEGLKWCERNELQFERVGVFG